MNSKFRILIAFVCLPMFSCDVWECLLDVSPQIHDKELRIALVDEPYEDFITSDIKNYPGDNSFEYFYSVSGNFPPGLGFEQDYRHLYFTGTPTTAGAYEFKVDLYVIEQGLSDDEDSSVCDSDTAKHFTIIVQ